MPEIQATQTELIADLETLNQIAVILNRALDVRSALSETLPRLIKLMDLETGWIFVYDETDQSKWCGRGYVLAAHYNLPPAMSLDNPTAWYSGCDCQGLCNRGELQQAYNEIKCSRLAKLSGDRRGLTVHASAPLCSGDQVLGILNVAAPDWSAFSLRTLALLTNVGNQIGVALERARLFEMVREQRIMEQAALLKFSSQLLGQVSLDEMLNFLVEEVCRLMKADAVAVLLPGEGGKNLYFRAETGWRSDPVGNRHRVPNDERSGSGRVMQTQQPIIMEDVSHIPTENRSDWMQIDWLQTENFLAAAIVPMMADGRSIGVLVLDMRQPHRFTEAETHFLQLMANQAALAIEKARLQQDAMRRLRMEEELAVGRQIQLSMLPREWPQVDGWDFVAFYEGARQVSGDFYDFFPMPGEPAGRWAVVVADVSDKGVPAALFMALSRTTIRNTVLRGREPAEALVLANRFIQEDSGSDMFLSILLGALNTTNGRFTFANAGHTRPLWWQKSSQRCRSLVSSGVVLGVLAEVEIEEQAIDLAPGDVLVCFTDGVTDAINEHFEEYGQDRLERVVNQVASQPQATARAISEAILDDVHQFVAATDQYDDITMVVIQRHEAE
jgi:serine phosphatase RsbU (regulator of sigma subunit)